MDHLVCPYHFLRERSLGVADVLCFEAAVTKTLAKSDVDIALKKDGGLGRM